MDTNRIVNSKGKIISKLSIKDYYSKIVGFSSNFIGKAIITGISLFVAYLFYQLGYALLYGYYFGGNEYEIAPLTIMINQIPFDIKYVAVLGVFILSIILLILLLSYKFIVAKDNFNQRVIILFCTLMMYYLLCILITLTIGKLEMIDSSSDIYKSVFYLFYLIFSILNCLIYFAYIYDNIFIGLVLIFSHVIVSIFIIVCVNSIENCNILIWLLVVLGIYVITSLLMYIIHKILEIFMVMLTKIKSYYINHFKQISLLLATILIFNIIIKLPLHIWFIMIDGCLLIINLIIWAVVKIRKKVYATKNIKINITHKMNKKSVKNEKTILILSLSGLLIILLTGYIFLYSAFYFLGNSIGDVSNTHEYSNINILNENFSCDGIVVKQDGDTYYIADNNRKLVIITAEQVVITMPHNIEK